MSLVMPPLDTPSAHQAAVYPVLILKTAALGDVLRTTSILPGLAARAKAEGRELRVTWLTAKGAEDLLLGHGLVDEVLTVELGDPASVAAILKRLNATRWSRVLSFDDEAPLCAIATAVGRDRISGAYLDGDGDIAYTQDVAPWFDMGLISVFGKQEADRLKVANQKSHPAIFAEMIGVEPGEPGLELPKGALDRAQSIFSSLAGPLIGLNTGAGGRWTSKSLAEERVVEVAQAIDAHWHATHNARPTFVLLGGPEERERHGRLLTGLGDRVTVFDAKTDNSLQDFAALIDGLDLLITSDSLAMHIAIARRRQVMAFFAPTSAAEIDLFGRGSKVQSTASDYCSYQPGADRSTLTTERLVQAALGCLDEPQR
jgi:heptosyltransferase-2